jgi:branched-chain amino acid transport system ATP-binding protein
MSDTKQNNDPGATLLDVRGLTAGYGGQAVVYGIDLTVASGEIVVILGSNGAGKTTTLKSIVGLLRPEAAMIDYAGSPWQADKPWRAASAGMSFIPAERFTFAELTVDENLALGAHAVDSAAEDERREDMLRLFPILAKRGGQRAGTMSGGEQRMLSLAVALMSRPKLLLLDEPSLGLAPAVVQQIAEVLRRLVDAQGLSVLMVEQNVGQILQTADRAYVMRSGRIILEAKAEEIGKRDQLWDLF